MNCFPTQFFLNSELNYYFMEYDIIVIGGSANGAQAALSAVKQGVSVAVIEEHPSIGMPEHCSGLFSYWGLHEIDNMPPDDIIFNNKIYGSRIIAPNGKVLTVRKDKIHAIVCDRAAYDAYTMKKALDAGITLYQPYRAVTAVREDDRVNITIRSKDEELQISARMIISAEGIRATIANQLGLQGPPKNEFVNAAQFYMYGLNNMDPELVEVYQYQKYAEDFFAWVIPMDKYSAKVGLGTKKKYASKQLENMIKEHPVLRERCEGAEIRRRTAGRIPTTGPVKRTYADNLLLTGDVAGQTKPTTGGGVILGGMAAQIAGTVAADAIKQNNTSARFLKRYQKQWKKKMSRNLKMMRLVRKYMNVLSDKEIDTLFSKMDSKGILDDIEKYGHVDDQATIVKKFMFTWKLYPFYLRTSGRLLKSIFTQ